MQTCCRFLITVFLILIPLLSSNAWAETPRKPLRIGLTPVILDEQTAFLHQWRDSSDTQSRSLAELKGKVFAFSDADSNSGYLSPRYETARMIQVEALSRQSGTSPSPVKTHVVP